MSRSTHHSTFSNRSAAIGLIIAGLSLFVGCNNSRGNGPAATFTVGGTLVNLAPNSDGIVLQNDGTDDLTLNANGTFQFPVSVVSGGRYDVTVMSQPSTPAQTCDVTAAIGAATENINTVKVDCSHNEWAWMSGSQAINQIGTYGTLGAPNPRNTPGGRQFPATWTDSSGNLWLFGGYGYDSAGQLLPFNDLWKFSSGQWTWMGGPTLAGAAGNYGTLGVPSSTNIPGARFEAMSWTDSAGNFWLFGGVGFDSQGNESPMNDLWKYSKGEWTWMGGSKAGGQHGVYGTMGIADPSNMPGGRSDSIIWLDRSGKLWLFGGIGYDQSSPYNGELNDLWEYSDGEWTWMAGDKVEQQAGNYGAEGVASPMNLPSARVGAYGWIDATGNLWVFGGAGIDSTGAGTILNDLWEYSPSSGEWTWVSGSDVGNKPGVYGTKGLVAATNMPGGRQYGIAWADAEGNAWIFGGNGLDATGGAGGLNDLWEYSAGQWTWMSRANVVDQNSSFGVEGSPAPGNAPGGRSSSARWLDSNQKLWLFGGYGSVSGNMGNLNDLWIYTP